MIPVPCLCQSCFLCLKCPSFLPSFSSNSYSLFKMQSTYLLLFAKIPHPAVSHITLLEMSELIQVPALTWPRAAPGQGARSLSLSLPRAQSGACPTAGKQGECLKDRFSCGLIYILTKTLLPGAALWFQFPLCRRNRSDGS